MAYKKEKKQFESWEEVIIDFFEYRVSKSNLYKARESLEKSKEKLKGVEDDKKINKIQKEILEKENILIELRHESPKGEIKEWIKKISKNNLSIGKRFKKGTHLLKFSHSSAPPEALLIDEKDFTPILSTSSFDINKRLTYDIAMRDGSLITIARFFALRFKGRMIFDLVMSGDFSFLDPFVSYDKERQEIQQGLANMIEKREIKTAEKTKQLYFPVSENPTNDKEDYHLLVPLFSSSLCEEIYSYIRDLTFDENNREIRGMLKKSFSDNSAKPVYKPSIFINVSDSAVLKFGGNQPQNVSVLNMNRLWKASPKDKNAVGITYLFSSQPPTWQSQLNPPIYRKSLFDDLYSSNINTEINYIRDFLLRFKSLGLSIKDPKRKRHLIRWVNNIIDEFLFYVGSIQALPASWSSTEGIKLKQEHQYLLDPYRRDDDFQKKRQSVDWQSIVREDFARWLNARLRGKDKQFTPQAEHTRMWKDLLADPLRDYMERVDYEVKQHNKEDV